MMKEEKHVAEGNGEGSDKLMQEPPAVTSSATTDNSAVPQREFFQPKTPSPLRAHPSEGFVEWFLSCLCIFIQLRLTKKSLRF